MKFSAAAGLSPRARAQKSSISGVASDKSVMSKISRYPPSRAGKEISRETFENTTTLVSEAVSE